MKIANLDIPGEVRSFYIESGISELYPPQIKAVEAGLLESRNLLAAVPTASGKTMIAELAMLKSIFNGGKCLYIVPLRALASEKFQRFKEFESIGVRAGISSGDFDSRDEWLAKTDIIVATSDLSFKDPLKTTNKQTNLCSPYQNINPLATDLPTFP